jgi:hypothetical protein
MALADGAIARLRSLLFSRDPDVISLVTQAQESLNIDVYQCSVAQEAVQTLTRERFDVIMVDNADASGAVAVLSAAKDLPSCEQSIGIVLATSPSSIGLAEGARSHMVIYRPLSLDRLRNGIKSALGLRNVGSGEEERESERASASIPATLRGVGLEGTLAFITNISAGGAALSVGQFIPPSCIQTIEFSLPDTNENLSVCIELVWRDVQGRMGVRFAGMSTEATKSLQAWLDAHPVLQRTSQASA